ncbi:MAG TPA: hypothetical protein VNN55_10680 [bacterium]|nr:hypothetical protein [bacterium]
MIGNAVLAAGVLAVICPATGDAAFRPAERTSAHLGDERRLQLAIGRLVQELRFGPVNGSVALSAPPLAPVASPGIVSAAASSVAGSSEEIVACIPDAPVVSGTVASVPIRILTRCADSSMAMTREVVAFVRDERGRWMIPESSIPAASPLARLSGPVSKAHRGSPVAAATATGLLGDFTYLERDSVLLEKELYPGMAVFTSASSRRRFGHDIASVPWGVCAAVDYSPNIAVHDYVAVTDWSWAQVLGADADEPEFIAPFGSQGPGPEQFNRPMGICGGPYVYWIADAGNNRIAEYELQTQPNHPDDRTTGVTYRTQYTYGFQYPTDVDRAETRMVVADKGNNQVVLFGFGAPERIGPPTGGGGILEFRSPSSVCFGRSVVDGAQIDTVIYVADQGNHRVCRLIRSPYAPFGYNFDEFDLPGTTLQSVDVDNFGNLYALDADSGRVYKFSPSLEPLAVYRFRLPDGVVVRPHDFAIAHGRECVPITSCRPMQLADALLTTEFTGNSGIYRFQIGIDVIAIGAYHLPPNDFSPDTGFVLADYHLTDAAEVFIRVYQGSTTVGFLGPVVQPAGAQRVAVPLLGSIPTGQYIVEIDAISVYDNSNTYLAEMIVAVDNSFNHLPRILSPPSLLCHGACDTCVENGTITWFRTNAVDSDGVVVAYQWRAGYGGLFVDNFCDTVTTSADSVLCQVQFGYPTLVGGMNLVPEDTALRVRALDNRGSVSPPAKLATALCDCVCPCLSDPQCDGVIDVLDVVSAVGRAFRGAAGTGTPYCPIELADNNCDGVVDVSDIVRLVNVAFRSASPLTLACDACGP